MPQHKSCKKRMKTSLESRDRNRAFRSQMRGAIKELKAITSKEEASGKYREVMGILDKAASYGLIHKKNASRHKSRLAMYVNKLP